MSSEIPLTLLKHLTSSFSTYPTPYKITLHLLTTQPKRTNALYPFAVNPPRVWSREVLVIVTAEVEEEQASSVGQNGAEGPSTATAEEKGKRQIMLAAMETCIYTIPSTSSTLLYISKVDSTGYHPSRSPTSKKKIPPVVKILTKSFLQFYLSPSTRPTERVFVQLFARSQNQYLFPNSILGGGKNVLGGTRLCGWWKSVMEEVAIGLLNDKTEDGSIAELALTFSLPSYDEEEGRNLLGLPRNQLPAGTSWQYLPPNHPSLPVPSSMSSLADPTIAQLIPTFSDDPKARFLLELSYTRPSKPSESHDPPTKKRKVGAASSLAEIKEARKDFDVEERREATEALAKVGYAEFWERMGFRQECISGDVVGFFGMMVYPGMSTKLGEPASIVGSAEASSKGSTTGPPGNATDLPPPIFARLLAALLNHDFGSLDLAIEGSDRWISTTEKIVRTEIGDRWTDCVGVVEVNEAGRIGHAVKKEEKTVVVNVMAVKKKPKKVVV